MQGHPPRGSPLGACGTGHLDGVLRQAVPGRSGQRQGKPPVGGWDATGDGTTHASKHTGDVRHGHSVAPWMASIQGLPATSGQETHDPSERIFTVFSAFFPGKVSVRARGLTSLPSPGADDVGCTTHVLRFYRQRHGTCRETWSYPLRPRNSSVPSYRPPQQAGCTCAVRQ